MKKIITVLLSVLLIAGLFTGCNGDAVEELFRGNTPTPTPTPTPEPVEYTVTFNSNGGEGSMEPQIFTEGETQALSQNTFTKCGYLFCGWSKTSDGETADYTDEESITITADITLYAIWSPVPFKLVAQEDGVTVKINKSSSTDAPVISLVYRKTNGTGWTEWTDYTWDSEEGYEIQLNNAEEVEIKAKTTNESFGNSYHENNYFLLTGNVAARGNIMFLLDSTGKSTEVPEYCFCNLFEGCNTLTEAPELPATTLGEFCYENMFVMCSALTKAPELLPALTLTNGCYEYMFAMTSLTESPVLPATTLAENCYMAMFYGCEALVKAPALPATTLADMCYASMYQSCEALTEAPALPATTLAENCYSNMFAGCSSLATGPELPATALAVGCYCEMFGSCTELTEAPELPATTLVLSCYERMFKGCIKLNSVKVAFEDWNESSGSYQSTDSWLYEAGTDSSVTTHTFACPAALQLAGTMSGGSEDTIPDGWTVVNL